MNKENSSSKSGFFVRISEMTTETFLLLQSDLISTSIHPSIFRRLSAHLISGTFTLCELKLSTMELHSVFESIQANSNPKELFFDRLRKSFLFELVVQVKGGVAPCLWPFLSSPRLRFSLRTPSHRKKSIKAYLNEEGRDTMALSESRAGDQRGRCPGRPLRPRWLSLWTSACANPAGHANEWQESAAGSINVPVSVIRTAPTTPP